jgi:hypothetical protein
MIEGFESILWLLDPDPNPGGPKTYGSPTDRDSDLQHCILPYFHRKKIPVVQYNKKDRKTLAPDKKTRTKQLINNRIRIIESQSSSHDKKINYLRFFDEG